MQLVGYLIPGTLRLRAAWLTKENNTIDWKQESVEKSEERSEDVEGGDLRAARHRDGLK